MMEHLPRPHRRRVATPYSHDRLLPIRGAGNAPDIPDFQCNIPASLTCYPVGQFEVEVDHEATRLFAHIPLVPHAPAEEILRHRL
jgi:hypothetical protein